MVYLDANVILRYILCDDEILSENAKKIIYKGDCIATNEVIAEVVYVLCKVYKVSRDKIRDSLFECMKKISVQNKNVMTCTKSVCRKKF